MYPKKIERNIGATSCSIVALKAALSDMSLLQNTATTTSHEKPSFNRTISPSWKRSSLSTQILVISQTKLSNDYLGQTPKDHMTRTMKWIQTLRTSSTSILLHHLFHRLQRFHSKNQLPTMKLSSSNLHLMQSSQ